MWKIGWLKLGEVGGMVYGVGKRRYRMGERVVG